MKEKVKFLGIDIGGAHIKTVGLDEKKKIIFVSQEQCLLWRDTKLLENYFKKINNLFTKVKCGITMTGELCDYFKSRKHGVKSILKVSQKLKFNTFFFTNKSSFFLKKSSHTSIASMNWLATGKFLETKIKDALIIDFGSTTTDLIIIKNNKVQNKFYTDFDRMNNNELIYSGLTRTPTSFLTNSIDIKNKKYYLSAEFFSNTADLYRIKKILPPNSDIFESADGRSKSTNNSLNRLARNFCLDYERKNLKFLNIATQKLINIQIENVFKKSKQLMKTHKIKSKIPIVVCGIGKDIFHERAHKKKCKVIDFSSFLSGKKGMKLKASFHAPATSCAILISEIK